MTTHATPPAAEAAAPDVAALRAAALAATPGPWKTDHDRYISRVGDGFALAEAYTYNGHPNAAYIAAANPRTLLALLDALAAAEQERDRLRDSNERLQAVVDEDLKGVTIHLVERDALKTRWWCCGEETDTVTADAAKAHAETCDKHPLHAARQQLAAAEARERALVAALRGIHEMAEYELTHCPESSFMPQIEADARAALADASGSQEGE